MTPSAFIIRGSAAWFPPQDCFKGPRLAADGSSIVSAASRWRIANISKVEKARLYIGARMLLAPWATTSSGRAGAITREPGQKRNHAARNKYLALLTVMWGTAKTHVICQRLQLSPWSDAPYVWHGITMHALEKPRNMSGPGPVTLASHYRFKLSPCPIKWTIWQHLSRTEQKQKGVYSRKYGN